MNIHVIVRAYIKNKNNILVAKTKEHYFLPGGHVKYNESMQTALLRELSEEMYIDIDQVDISKFIGAIEHCWDSSGAPFHELSLIFSAHIENISSAAEVISREPHLKFYWINLDELTNINLHK